MSYVSEKVAYLNGLMEGLGIGDATAIDKAPKKQPPLAPDPCITDTTGKGGVDASITTRTINRDISQADSQQESE